MTVTSRYTEVFIITFSIRRTCASACFLLPRRVLLQALPRVPLQLALQPQRRASLCCSPREERERVGAQLPDALFDLCVSGERAWLPWSPHQPRPAPTDRRTAGVPCLGVTFLIWKGQVGR